MDDERKANLVEAARNIASALRQEHDQITAACIVSSLASGDYTPASDVDMLVIYEGADRPVPHKVYRRIPEDTVIEWVVIPSQEVTDMRAVLGHAGLVHDLRTCLILFDQNGILRQAKNDVLQHWTDPSYLSLRVKDQLDRLHRSIGQMEKALKEANPMLAVRAHVAAIKSLFGLPRAVANLRCTMGRAVLFCHEAAEQLGWREYTEEVLATMGTAELDAADVRELTELAMETIDRSKLEEEERSARLRHLRVSRWLLENGHVAAAVWPLYFWTSKTVAEQVATGSDSDRLRDTWRQFSHIIGVATVGGLEAKCELLRKLAVRAKALSQDRLGCLAPDR